MNTAQMQTNKLASPGEMADSVIVVELLLITHRIALMCCLHLIADQTLIVSHSFTVV